MSACTPSDRPSASTPTPTPTTLIVTPVSNLAGVARHVIDLARVGIPGWRIVVTGPEGPLLEELRALGTPVVPLPLDEASVPRAVAALRALIRHLRPAIVHSHLAKADILATLAAAALPTRLVTTEHHIPPDRFMFHGSRPKAMAMETVHHLRLRRVGAAMAVSDSTARDMRRWWHTSVPITVVHNGVDRLESPPQRHPGLRFLSLTRLSPEKNVQATLRAFALVAVEHPEARLTIAGEGPEAPSLRDLARDLGIADRVEFPGFVDPVTTMDGHDVIVQPSKSDNFSYTLLDAVVHGMGVAASPIGGNPEMLPPRCIAPFDDDAALARIMVEQGQDLAVRPELPASVPTVAGMAAQVAQVYAGVLTGGPEVAEGSRW
ncbi:glycosyltransferase family 4 protein [Brachybacterium sp. EF45031]|uniref:glycosyltransferase family 4 protein n=1 Tax=Brachybacterium sillae TaxID=2810536 RepID=UPI00217D978A|nr:glycosyltransferase family 4 protein [Brachybacterium sillae]MCS6711629.1 glycosyltransferase family 4 protein [Brachybacterium sillae]